NLDPAVRLAEDAGLPKLFEDAGDGDTAHTGDGRDLLVGVRNGGTGAGAAGVQEIGHPLVILQKVGTADIVGQHGDPPHKMGHQVLGRIAVLLPQLPKAVCRQQIDLRRRDGGHADHDLGVIHQGAAAEQIAGSQVKEGDLISAGTEAEGAELPLDQKACLCGQ
ncbi:RNA polymerase sigma factor sigM, partial [Dysosmobacter welbionis]